METFGQILRRHREGRGLSLRKLGELTTFGFTYLSQVERGERRPTEKVARLCDKALEAGGAIVEAYIEEQAGERSMQRRTVVRAMGALAVSPLPLVQWEALRHGMGVALDPEFDRWDQVVTDYGTAYYQLPAEQLMDNLRADLTVLQALIPVTDEPVRSRLLRAAGFLSVIVALNMVAAGQTLAARRWWQDAKRFADHSGDADIIVLTRAWGVVNGCYDGHNPSQVIALADEVFSLAERPTAASCGLLAGRAQALSLAGRHTDAVNAVRKLGKMAESLPSVVVNDTDSLWGWPEHRLRHTEAWVFAHAGRLTDAQRAKERAVALYPAKMSRLRTQVQLHHASALIRDGHIPDGLRLAADVLDQLPAQQHNELLRTVARQVVDAVPDRERGQSAYRALTDRVGVRHGLV